MKKFGIYSSIFVCAMLLSVTMFPGVLATYNGTKFVGELPADSVEAHWKLDETSGSTANDETTNHNGDIYGTPNLDQQGKLGRSIDFDGSDDYIEVGDDPGLDFGNNVDFSIFCWIKPDSNSCPILTKTSGIRGYWMRINASGFFQVQLGIGPSTTGATYDVNIVNDGEWHHVGLVRDGDTVEAWVDGVLEDSNTGASGSLANNEVLYIGSDGAGMASNYFDGKIDDVRIYRTIIDPTANMISHWKLDESSGITADDAMNVKDGTVYSVLHPPYWKPTGGKVGGCLDLDGSDDYVSVPDGFAGSYDFADDENFSIFLWIKPDNVNGEPILSKINTIGYRMRIDSSGYLFVEVDFGMTTKSVTGTTDLTLSTPDWFHVGMVRSGDTLEAWVNGYCEASDTGADGDISTSADLYFGREGADYLGGDIDDVRIFGEAVVPAN